MGLLCVRPSKVPDTKLRANCGSVQIVAEHRTYLSRLLTGFLLSKRVGALRRLIELKALATQFAALSGRLAIDTEALELDAVDVVTGAERAET